MAATMRVFWHRYSDIVFRCWNILFISYILTNFRNVNCNKAELYTSQSFSLIRSSSYPHFIMFYAPWCGHCKRVQSIWDKYAEENHLTKRLKVAKVDCTETIPLCASEDIKAYPTFKLFSHHEKYTYRGSRNIPGFNEFVNINIKNIKDGQVPTSSFNEEAQKQKLQPPSDTANAKPTVLTDETFHAEIKDDFTFVDFYAPWCAHCVRLEPVWDQLAKAYAHNPKITIAKVDCTSDPDLCKQQSINAFPALKMFKNGKQISTYQQSRELKYLMDFVDTTLESPESDVVADITKEELPEINLDDLEESVQYVDHVEFQRAVATIPHLIYFHNGWFADSYEYLDLFNEVFKELENLEYALIVKIMDCNIENEFCERFKMNEYPVIQFFTSEDNFIEYKGGMVVLEIIQFAIDQMNENLTIKKQKEKEEL